MLSVMMAIVVTGCAGRQLALSPDQCKAPTDEEAALTMNAWKGR
jgi:hypothetical protein